MKKLRMEIQTPRQKIRELLQEAPHSLREISQTLHLSEKQILAALPHVEKSLPPLGLRMGRVPAVCRRCDHIFKDRSRFAKPGKCPICKGSTIASPSFFIAALEEMG